MRRRPVLISTLICATTVGGGLLPATAARAATVAAAGTATDAPLALRLTVDKRVTLDADRTTLHASGTVTCDARFDKDGTDVELYAVQPRAEAEPSAAYSPLTHLVCDGSVRQLSATLTVTRSRTWSTDTAFRLGLHFAGRRAGTAGAPSVTVERQLEATGLRTGTGTGAVTTIAPLPRPTMIHSFSTSPDGRTATVSGTYSCGPLWLSAGQPAFYVEATPAAGTATEVVRVQPITCDGLRHTWRASLTRTGGTTTWPRRPTTFTVTAYVDAVTAPSRDHTTYTLTSVGAEPSA